MTDDFPPSPRRRSRGKKAQPAQEAATTKPKAKAKTSGHAKGDASAVLAHIGIDAICDRLEGGESISEIATSLGMNRSTLWRWLEADPQRSARAKESRELGAEADDAKALQVLLDASTDSAQHVSKAKEIAAHYRWRAKIKNPKAYGDRVQVDQTVDVSADTAALVAEVKGLFGRAGEKDEG